MPRTKINKTAKRNRDKDEVMKERLREYDAACDEALAAFHAKCARFYEDFPNQINILKSSLNPKFLQITIAEYMNILSAEKTSENFGSISFSSASIASKKSRDDEGYLTEESTGVNLGKQYSITSTSSSVVINSIKRTPGPLSLVKPRRRSRSACSFIGGGELRAKPSTVLHSARARLRTPQPTPRIKTVSVDRARITPKCNHASPPALYRWPKPGEIVISLSGSPVVSQMTPEVVANVNIPIRNGMLSLRPKKMEPLDENTLNDIDSETIKQIKQLQSNLSLIMNFAERKCSRNKN